MILLLSEKSQKSKSPFAETIKEKGSKIKKINNREIFFHNQSSPHMSFLYYKNITLEKGIKAFRQN